MKTEMHFACGVVLAVVAAATSTRAEDYFEVLKTPQGTYRLETEGGDKNQVLVSTKDGAEHVALPYATVEDPAECQIAYGISPDEKWIYRTESWRHHAVQNRQLYLHEKGARFAEFKGGRWFAPALEAYLIKNGKFKKASFDERRGADVLEDHLEARYRDWSPDSARLLLAVSATGDAQEGIPKLFYVYFNTRSKAFELTPYLRALNKRRVDSDKETEIPCAEPIDPLIVSEKYQAVYEKVDRDLRALFEKRIAHALPQNVDYWKGEQQEARKALDAGLALYLQFSPPKETEARRLQYLADATLLQFAALSADTE
ncbi:MAG: hypothetical protein ABJF10_18680 [Chthoniobacter sp.]|uniref:hypothetical protein n=1 Tax=Chthoniobacter sp. TaxID=2510640 RepID=UPI0032A9A439